jgi:hypothetical protein
MINSVRNAVLSIVNKNNYGYISPSDFNLFAQNSQMEIYEEYFSNYNKVINAENARTSGVEYADIEQPIAEVLEYFLRTDYLSKIAANKLRQEFNFDSLIVTLGPKGIFYSGSEDKLCPTISNNVFDVSGAGDTVFTCLGVCLANEFSLEDACKFANSAASIVIIKFGSETTTVDEVIENLKLNEKHFD